MQPVRTYCRGVLRGVAAVCADSRWETILVAADTPAPLSALSRVAQGVMGHFSDRNLFEQVARAGIPAVDVAPRERRVRRPRVSTDGLR